MIFFEDQNKLTWFYILKEIITRTKNNQLLNCLAVSCIRCGKNMVVKYEKEMIDAVDDDRTFYGIIGGFLCGPCSDKNQPIQRSHNKMNKDIFESIFGVDLNKPYNGVLGPPGDDKTSH